jgi:hypothetical protein
VSPLRLATTRWGGWRVLCSPPCSSSASRCNRLLVAAFRYGAHLHITRPVMRNTRCRRNANRSTAWQAARFLVQYCGHRPVGRFAKRKRAPRRGSERRPNDRAAPGRDRRVAKPSARGEADGLLTLPAPSLVACSTRNIGGATRKTATGQRRRPVLLLRGSINVIGLFHCWYGLPTSATQQFRQQRPEWPRELLGLVRKCCSQFYASMPTPYRCRRFT